jgi:uncharacterized protein
MLDFQRYQAEFTAHIRNPQAHKQPTGIVPARMAVYRKAVFNNIVESTSVCFPVCQTVLGKRAWQKLMREFVANFAAGSPIFREIPQQLLQFLNEKVDCEPYIKQLAHYEWVELAVSGLETKAVKLSKKTDLLKESAILAPHMLLEYDFAVHKISARIKPKTNTNTKTNEKTYLLVFRNATFEVKFIELNPMTFMLMQIIEKNNMAGEQALMRLAEQVNNDGLKIESEIILKFGAEILQDLAYQQAIIGSNKV